jgi:hypothetical protein
MAGKPAVAARTSAMARTRAASSASSPSVPRGGVPDSTGPAAPSVTRIMLSRVGEALSIASSRPAASRRTRRMGCSSEATARACSASAASHGIDQEGHVVGDDLGDRPRPRAGAGRQDPHLGRPGGAVLCEGEEAGGGGGQASGGSAASSAVGTAACRSRSRRAGISRQGRGQAGERFLGRAQHLRASRIRRARHVVRHGFLRFAAAAACAGRTPPRPDWTLTQARRPG